MTRNQQRDIERFVEKASEASLMKKPTVFKYSEGLS